VLLLASVLPGGRPAGEDAEHGAVPADGHGHGAARGEEEPEQLESALPLVPVEAALRPGKEPRRLPVRPVRRVQPPREHARGPLHG